MADASPYGLEGAGSSHWEAEPDIFKDLDLAKTITRADTAMMEVAKVV